MSKDGEQLERYQGQTGERRTGSRSVKAGKGRGEGVEGRKEEEMRRVRRNGEAKERMRVGREGDDAYKDA